MAVAFSIASLCDAARAAAQVPRDSAVAATLTGTFRDRAGAPVRGARVTIASGALVAISDSVGHFVVHGLTPAATEFTVHRIGYEPGRVTLNLRPGEALDVDFTLVDAAVELPAVESNATNTWLKKFNDHRASQGGGHFFTREDIEKANPRQLSDMLRSIPGLQLSAKPVGPPTVRMARSNLGAFGDCPVQYWVDGMRATDFELDDVAPREVEAIEVYSGPATLPPEYRTRIGTSSCGTIAIWTRMP
ncbi:MAG TPA: carboxypeptidase regulatory-like domain-containing protein [Gemmatimonadaceae bacterium]|nr:carboxypeptidase regulatory-like domain-containing protein [Gemmatimonadaceae bacterium]